jgi:aryl-alcohol dehydrogenase-like predicted oxidoreductase
MTTTLPTRRLGRTGFQLNPFGLGTYQITGDFDVPRADALALLDHAIRGGVNYMDTAPMYGSGESEELIGRALARHRGQHVFISTKVGYFGHSVARQKGAAAYQDEDSIRRGVEHSMHLLGRDYIDMVFVHEPEMAEWGFDYATGEAVVTRTLEALKREGAIGAIGLGSNFYERALDLVKTGRFDVVELAHQYNLVQRAIPRHIIPEAKKHDVGVIVGGPFRGGLFATADRALLARMKAEGKAFSLMSVDDLAKIEALYDLADEWEITVAELSIRFLLSNPDIHALIPGARNVAELDINLAAAKGPLDPEQLARVLSITGE